MFVNTVTRNYDISMDTVLTNFGQDALLVGADAVQAGMANRIGSLESVIARLAGVFLKKSRYGRTSKKKESPGITAKMFAQLYPLITESFGAEGALQERERTNAVEEQLISGHEVLIEQLKFDGKPVMHKPLYRYWLRLNKATLPCSLI